MEAGFLEVAAVFGGGIRGCLGSSSSTWTLGGTLPATKMPRQRDLLRALVTLMKTLAAAYGITISATNVRPEVVQPPKSMPQTLKLKGPAPQFHKEISPLSGQTGEYC